MLESETQDRSPNIHVCFSHNFCRPDVLRHTKRELELEKYADIQKNQIKKKLEVEREVDLSGQNKMAGSDGHKREGDSAPRKRHLRSP